MKKGPKIKGYEQFLEVVASKTKPNENKYKYFIPTTTGIRFSLGASNNEPALPIP